MKILKRLSILISVFLILSFFYLFLGKAPRAQKVEWGVVFSQKHSQLLGLDWKKVFLGILDDLKVKKIKIITHWDLIEKANNDFSFQDLDWQIDEAKKRGVKMILVLGMKTGRWPECHLPQWAKNLKGREREKEILEYLKTVILRYKNESSIFAWQIENEPFFPFGECPKIKRKFFKREIELVKSLDQRPIIFGDSGEFSFWIEAAKFGDIVGTTLHKRVYFKEIKRYINYPFPPVYYWRKAKIIEFLFNKRVINVELQAEPWCQDLIYNCPLKEQKITMDFEKFKEILDFAEKTGFDEFYFWGVEWWYWLKARGDFKIWQESKKYF